MTCRFRHRRRLTRVAALRRALGHAGTGWAWDASLSLRVDALVYQIERAGGAARVDALQVQLEDSRV